MQWTLSTVLGLAVAFSSPLSVFAQTCTVTGTQPAKMALVAGNVGRLSSRPDQSQTAQLGSITLTCTAGMHLLINPPIARGSTPSTGTPGVEVWDGSPLTGGGLLTQVTNFPVSIPLSGPFTTNRVLSFNLYVDSASGGLMTPGDYTYDFQLVLTPK